MAMVAGIILAGGTSERLQEYKVPKQFISIGGMPLIMFSVAAFETCSEIDAFTIVAPKDRHGELQQWFDKLRISKFRVFAMPGKTRQHSIYNGLTALQTLKPSRVVIHDAARPCISDKELSACVFLSVRNGGDGATPVLPPDGTVYLSADGKTITGLLNRDELAVGLTPECYDYAKYSAAHEGLSDEQLSSIRGSSELAFKAGMKINIYPGDPSNRKIATADDLEYFKSRVKR